MKIPLRTILILAYAILADVLRSAEGARMVSFHDFNNCIELKNKMARAVLCPTAGGRVLEFSIQGKNALWLNPEDPQMAEDAAREALDKVYRMIQKNVK